MPSEIKIHQLICIVVCGVPDADQKAEIKHEIEVLLQEIKDDSKCII